MMRGNCHPLLRKLKGKYVAGMAVAGMAVPVHISFAINLVLFFKPIVGN